MVIARPIKKLLCGLQVLALVLAAGVAAADGAELTIRADAPGDTISKYVYGQFAEHLGRGIYGGIWVGENSAIENTRGFRDDVVGALKKLRIPVIRWPGGCFADEYHWRDGIGPRDERPVRINTHWGWVHETNEFGTHEFMELVELLDSEAYIAMNIGSGSPREMGQWLEYMTADNDTTLARERRANGREEPWQVAFIGVGNETWGCGGNMTPAYYTDLYRRYSTFLKAPGDNKPKLIASGGSNEETQWTEALIGGTQDRGPFFRIDGISHHYYTLPTGQWETKGKAVGFPEDEWISTFANTLRIDEYLNLNEAVLEQYDPDGDIGIYLDEWGTWYDPQEHHDPGFLYQQNSIRDALLAALNFNIFHQHTARLHMANIAQTVNVLQAVVLTDNEKMLLTPTYHAFEMYIPFQGATFVPIALSDVPDYRYDEHVVPQVSASAAITEEGELVVAIVNLHADADISIAARVEGFASQRATGRVLTGDSIDAHNTFDAPNNVRPRPLAVDLQGGAMSITLPPRSVSVVTVSR